MWLAGEVGEAAAQGRARNEVEVGAATIEGPGEGLLSIKDKAVRGIDEGDRRYIALRWNATEHWYVKGAYARTTVRYANPLDPACPLSASAVGRGAFGFGQLCQIEVADRLEGQIDEKLLAHEFMIGHRAPLSERWSVDAAIGVGRLRWESQDDIEAYDTSRCREELDRIVPRPQPPFAGCQQIQPRARESGAVALLSLAYSPTPRITLRADGHF